MTNEAAINDSICSNPPFFFLPFFLLVASVFNYSQCVINYTLFSTKMTLATKKNKTMVFYMFFIFNMLNTALLSIICQPLRAQTNNN